MSCSLLLLSFLYPLPFSFCSVHLSHFRPFSPLPQSLLYLLLLQCPCLDPVSPSLSLFAVICQRMTNKIHFESSPPSSVPPPFSGCLHAPALSPQPLSIAAAPKGGIENFGDPSILGICLLCALLFCLNFLCRTLFSPRPKARRPAYQSRCLETRPTTAAETKKKGTGAPGKNGVVDTHPSSAFFGLPPPAEGRGRGKDRTRRRKLPSSSSSSSSGIRGILPRLLFSSMMSACAGIKPRGEFRAGGPRGGGRRISRLAGLTGEGGGGGGF